jgi:hypothetical protein
MRKVGLALALVATTQVCGATLFSSTAWAADASASGSASVSIGGSASASSSGSASGSAAASTSGTGTASGAAGGAAGADDTKKKDEGKIKTGWILVGVGGVVGITGIVVDVVAANSGTVAGEGGAGDNGNTDNTRTDLYFLGTSLLFAGIDTAVYDGSMVWSGNGNGNGDQDTKPEERRNEDARTDSVTKVAQARYSSAPSFVLPIVGATF